MASSMLLVTLNIVFTCRLNLDVNQEIMGKLGSKSHSYCIHRFLRLEIRKVVIILVTGHEYGEPVLKL